MRAGFEWPRKDPLRTEFLRVRQTVREGQMVLEAFPKQGAGVLTSVAWADGLVRVAPNQTIKPGDLVDYLPLSALLA